jgi:indolepyruvate ferredoxin oxidoreductase
VRITKQPVEGTNKLGAGTLDTYLVFDVVAALAPATLDAASAARTVAIVSTTRSATGGMIGRPELHQPADADLRRALEEVTRARENVYLDAASLARGLFADAASANVLLLGVAYQAGALPVSAEAIEQAIELNGVAVATNTRAFRCGRLWFLEPDVIQRSTSSPPRDPRPTDAAAGALIGESVSGELRRLLAVRVPDLADYQDLAYAEEYVRTVELVARHEARVTTRTELSEAVARNLYKLMAYKDEYEVARLHLEVAVGAQVAEVAKGRDVRASWNLHPPVLRALGMQTKRRLGPAARPVMRGLRAMKRVRGTAFDPFGHTTVRNTERALVREYRALVERVAGRLSEENYNAAVALASLPDMVRGYEEVKLANVERYRRVLEDARAAFEDATARAASAASR